MTEEPLSTTLTGSSPVHTLSPSSPPLQNFAVCGETHFSFFYHAIYSLQHLVEEKNDNGPHSSL